jgi:serine kinase of HPr protein (carbohydrate metabolism regulator)
MTPGAAEGEAWLHASACLVGEVGLLILGRSGAGKSRLAMQLVAEGLPDGAGRRLAGHLVADDRVLLTRAASGRLLASAHPAIRGLIEVRGEGILPVPAEPAMVVSGVVALAAGEAISRLPEPDDLAVSLLGVRLARVWLAESADPRAQLSVAWPRFLPRIRKLMTI